MGGFIVGWQIFMIILLSKDFVRFAEALQKSYDEPIIQFLDSPNWTHDLLIINKGKFVSRLSFIGHSDCFYGEDQVFFGGNLSERVMLIDEFAHALITLLKFNERLKPGFCQHLKTIDIIDCHTGERKFMAQKIAEFLHADSFLAEHGTHIKVTSFAHPDDLKLGTVLLPHPLEHDTVSFYTFDSSKAYTRYKNAHVTYIALKDELHHLEQIPGHSPIQAKAQSREEKITDLKQECDRLLKKKHKILHTQAHGVLHISDPRKYLDKHHECQIMVGKVKVPHHKKRGSTHHTSKHHLFAKTAPEKSKSHPRTHKHHHNFEDSIFKDQDTQSIEAELTTEHGKHKPKHHKK